MKCYFFFLASKKTPVLRKKIMNMTQSESCLCQKGQRIKKGEFKVIVLFFFTFVHLGLNTRKGGGIADNGNLTAKFKIQFMNLFLLPFFSSPLKKQSH